MSKTIAQLRESLTPEDIKNVLAKYDIFPVIENNRYLVYPTVCHNVIGGSNKLFYYFNSFFFRCYTECDTTFDIFELLIKIHRIRFNEELKLSDVLKIVGFQNEHLAATDGNIEDDFKDLERIKRNQIKTFRIPEAHELNRITLERYTYNEEYLLPWYNEGISYAAMQRFEIKYDPLDVAIVIPHKDKDGRIIGIRGRFMAEDAKNKYMPLFYKGRYLAHSLGENLYGLYENQNAIKKTHTVILFEGEKSVLKMDSVLGADRNCSVATCGNKITNEQIQLLRAYDVKEVVLAFDKDYHNSVEMVNVQRVYEENAKRLSTYFNVSIIMDYGQLLDYKDSPIDKGKEVFQELYKYRYFI